jgi:hypothetical protein
MVATLSRNKKIKNSKNIPIVKLINEDITIVYKNINDSVNNFNRSGVLIMVVGYN